MYQSRFLPNSRYIWFCFGIWRNGTKSFIQIYVERIQMNQELRHNKAIYCATILTTDATELTEEI